MSFSDFRGHFVSTYSQSLKIVKKWTWPLKTVKNEKLKNQLQKFCFHSYELALNEFLGILEKWKSYQLFRRFFGHFPYKSLYICQLLRVYDLTLKNHRKRSKFSWEVVEHFLILKPQKVDLSFKNKLKSIWGIFFHPSSRLKILNINVTY